MFALASPAAADTTVPIHSSQIPTTAEAFGGDDCTGPFADLDVDQDGWHFVTTGTASFTSVTLKFHTSGGDVTVVITSTDSTTPSSGPGWEGYLDNAGAAEKHAYLVTEAGWELFYGSAEVSGATDGDFFNLSHTCAGTETPGSPSPSPSPSQSGSESPSPSASESTDPGSPSQSTPPLPKTGTAIMGIALSGLAAVAVGAGILLVLRRRRDSLLTSSEE